MTYEQTLEFLYNQLPAYHRIGKAAYKDNLNNSIALDNHLMNPHKMYMTIHVAGTNGKGSVSHSIASILQEAGYKTGLYTSPHLKDYRERIRVNGVMIPEVEVISFVENNKAIIESISPSFFEMSVAMAFDYFAKCNIDIAVIETGLGGRLDSTNIITPVLSVITNIGTDHQDLLGYSFAEIANEKAGIIKENIPVIISESHIETKDIFLSRASELNSPIVFADERYSCVFDVNDFKKGERSFEITDLAARKSFYGETVLAGNYQSRNLQAVIAVINKLRDGFTVTDKNILDGIRNVIKNTGLAGRWHILGYNPFTVCDTGHNKEGLEYVMAQIESVSKSTLHIIIGFVNDKDLKQILPIFPKDAVYYFTRASVPRAMNEDDLKSEAAKYGLIGLSYPDVKNALLSAGKAALPSDMIFIGGSTFIVADAL